MAKRQATPPRTLRRRLIVVLIVYFLGGTASQKMLPGVDEVFPFFGWSLFSRVPDLASRYEILIHRHNGREVVPAETFLRAPPSMVTGDRYIARKVVQRLGRAWEEGEAEEIERLRRLLEQNYLAGRVEYELVFETYDPMVKWKTGKSTVRRSVGRFRTNGTER